MKTRIFNLLLFGTLLVVFAGCSKQNTPTALQIQKPNTYSDQYYANLRAYKASAHQIFYGWFAAYANKQGVIAAYKQSPSWGEHIAGIPDSVDFVSLWEGIPTDQQGDSLATYNPIAYNEMRSSMTQRGIKFVAPEIVQIQKYPKWPQSTVGIQDYANYLVNMVLSHNLDGLDLDYEPNGDWIGTGTNFAQMVAIIGKSLGPMSSNPTKYLIIDYYNMVPQAAVQPYINLLVNQAYTQGVTTTSAAFLQNNYNLAASWCPTSKFVVTENLGSWYATGGAPFTEADGNTLTTNGTQMYSLEGMARWNPTQGKKAGFGGFYFDDDYNTNGPYGDVRRCIQIANPAVH